MAPTVAIPAISLVVTAGDDKVIKKIAAPFCRGQFSEILVALTLCVLTRLVSAAESDVLWYSYADDASEYKSTISTIGANAGNYSLSVGNDWNLTFFGPGDPSPNFGVFDVLVIHGGEAFRTNPPGGDLVTPDFSGILGNRSAIESARGSRTFISGGDADFHAVRGDTGNPGDPLPATDAAWDGGLGYLVNAIDWASGGSGLNVVSMYDGEFPGSFWWLEDNSFLHDELFGYLGPIRVVRDNTPYLSPELSVLPVNNGLTSLGLSNWTWSFHGRFSLSTPGYMTTVLDDAVNPQWAVSIYRDAALVPLPGSLWILAPAMVFLLGRFRRV